jgi:hypothetical protein
MKQIILTAILTFTLVSCSTLGPTRDSSETQSQTAIDYEGIQRELGMRRAPQDLGFLERAFNTCEVGYGYSRNRDCRQEYLVVIHFQLLCRDSQGTVGATIERADMKPLSGRSVTWSIRQTKGRVRLDSQGYGQIKYAFSSSQRNQKLKLLVDNDFLYVTAGEITRIVAPSNWCN